MRSTADLRGYIPLILVSHLDIMDPNVLAPDIDAVEATLAAAPDDAVVDFTIRASIHHNVEFGRVDQGNIVETEVGDLRKISSVLMIDICRVRCHDY